MTAEIIRIKNVGIMKGYKKSFILSGMVMYIGTVIRINGIFNAVLKRLFRLLQLA